MTLTIGSLFSGYGGLDLAVADVFDAYVSWHVEHDASPSRILAHHWPDVPNYGDITLCDWAAMPPVDIITGGSPCQDLSTAGRRAGMTDGTRSNLWVHMREAIATIRPRYVIWENVQGALSAKAESASDMVPDAGPLGNPGDGHLRALGRVLGDLAEIGYDARWTTVRASDVGAPHHRARVFLLATPPDTEGIGPGERIQSLVTGVPATTRRSGAGAPEPGGAVPADTDSVGRGEGSQQPVAGTPEVTALVSDIGTLPRDRRTDDVLVLPTPVAQPSGNTPENHLRKKPGRSVVTDLSILVENDLLASGGVVLPTGTNERRGGKRSDELLLPGVAAAHAAGELLPTPRATRGGSATETMYKSGAVRDDTHRPQGEVVFPTPTTSEATGGKGPDSKRSGGEYLREVVTGVLPSPTASDASGGGLHPDHPGRQGHTMQLPDYVMLADEPDRWGKYAPAIARWERIVGPAPAPTEPNKNGKPRLNAAFAEWMMGLPPGWVTATGISRANQLKAIGNGDVPQQAAAAIRDMLGWQVAA